MRILKRICVGNNGPEWECGKYNRDIVELIELWCTPRIRDSYCGT